MPKKVFFAEPMTATPFQTGPRRQSIDWPEDIEIVDEAESADVIVARLLNGVAPHFHLNRQYFLWTHEPAWCLVTQSTLTDGPTGQVVHVSNAWNGDVYLTPLYYYPFYALDRDDLLERARAKTRKCALLATFRAKFDRYQGSVNVDLSEFRQRMAIGLQQRGFCDIYGRSWPDTIVRSGESRGGGWQDAKSSILADYAFNLACENTIAPNYITEKLWDAIRTASVPVYYARGTNVLSIMREGSFVDCSNLTDPAVLHQHLAGLTVTDRCDMLDSALADLAKINVSSNRKDVLRATVERFFDRIRSI